MALTVRNNCTIDGAFQVFLTRFSLNKQRTTQQKIFNDGQVRVAKSIAATVSGTLTFNVDSLRGVGVDLDEWERSEDGRLVEFDRGPKHYILRNCHISQIGDNSDPGAAQYEVTVNFVAESDEPIN